MQANVEKIDYQAYLKFKQMISGDAQKQSEKDHEFTDADKKKISGAYDNMYRGLTVSNWARENSGLGQSMYQAEEQMRSFTESKKKESGNPAVEYLAQIHASHSVANARQMMTNPMKDAVLNLPANQRQNIVTMGGHEADASMAEINSVLSKFRKNQKENAEYTEHLAENAKEKPAIEPENGSMMHSEKATNNKISAKKAVNQSPKDMTPDITDELARRKRFEMAKQQIQQKIFAQMLMQHQRERGA